jgi:long-subunit acyl-CoA synthetase (AMP-forming)
VLKEKRRSHSRKRYRRASKQRARDSSKKAEKDELFPTLVTVELPKMPKSWHIVHMKEVEALGEKQPAKPTLPKASDLAVIMYTSGSTGMPKVRLSSGTLKRFVLLGLFAYRFFGS